MARKPPLCWTAYFNPRSPRGERLKCEAGICDMETFQSTLPARGATSPFQNVFLCFTYFNPRSPRGERLAALLDNLPPVQFQSTLPARGATVLLPARYWPSSDFNPRSPRGERLYVLVDTPFCYLISIHAPREGSDTLHLLQSYPVLISIHAPREGSDSAGKTGLVHSLTFQSTLPARGATALVAG